MCGYVYTYIRTRYKKKNVCLVKLHSVRDDDGHCVLTDKIKGQSLDRRRFDILRLSWYGAAV